MVLDLISLSLPFFLSYLHHNFSVDTSFVPPLLYAALGVSREIAIGPVAVVSILLGTLAKDDLPIPAAATASCDTTSTKFINADCSKYREAYLALIFTATLFTGIFQAALGLTRSRLQKSAFKINCKLYASNSG